MSSFRYRAVLNQLCNVFHPVHIAYYSANAPSCKVLVQLQELNVSYNGLEGSLPETWGDLTTVSFIIAYDLLFDLLLQIHAAGHRESCHAV